ncbi:MAG: HpcH/HpaI aldolase/citrate lyase family protein [Pseudomonadota bacterium]|jgi:citrate lyase subunit beta / citryl-CoA lyase|nr:CoA ester lyase [Alphaproteobacteria bacterium]
MSKRVRRARRCQLSVPGSSEKMILKAAGLAEVDHVFLDLEDAVAPSAKPGARDTIADALNNLDWGKKVRCVRVNDCSTEWCHDDIIEVVTKAGRNLDTIMLTKAKSAADLSFVDTLLNQLEKKLGLVEGRIGIEVLIEEVEGMMNVEEIAKSTPRLECLIFGMGDYSASQGIDVRHIGGDSSYPGDIWHYTRFKMTVAARANGLDPVDGPFANFRNPQAYRREAERAAILGMVGKWAIHPSQVEIAQAVFSPDPKEVERARKLAAAYAEAVARGEGAVQYEGVMIDAASVRIVQNTLDKADLYGM